MTSFHLLFSLHLTLCPIPNLTKRSISSIPHLSLSPIGKMMHMTMYWGNDVTLLFDWWSTHSWPTYLLTLLACFLFSLLYQHLEHRRLQSKSSAAADSPSQPPSSAIATPLLSKLCRTHNPRRLADAALFGFNTGLGYFLMLAVMSFNGGVFLSVVLGMSVGYYLFRSGDEDGIRAVVVDNSCACS